jgi:hypothetical protein
MLLRWNMLLFLLQEWAVIFINPEGEITNGLQGGCHRILAIAIKVSQSIFSLYPTPGSVKIY